MKGAARCLTLALGLWAACLALAPSAAFAKSPTPGDAVKAIPGPPAYALLYEDAERLERYGDWAGALRVMSKIYGVEVPVESFYRSLEQAKLKIVRSLERDSSFQAGKEKYPVAGIRILFSSMLLSRPEIMYSSVDIDAELPLARLVYLFVVAGKGHDKPLKSPLLEHAAPKVNLEEALASPDPWLVSGALFLARKGQGRLQPQAVIDRWEQRPDLWDQDCTSQALLFLAGQSRAVLAGLRVKNSDVQGELARLAAIPAGQGCRVRTYYFWMNSLDWQKRDYLRKTRCPPSRVIPLSKRKEKPGECAQGLLQLSPGRYYLLYQGKQAHGTSTPFECRPGAISRVVIILKGHI